MIFISRVLGKSKSFSKFYTFVQLQAIKHYDLSVLTKTNHLEK